MSQFDLSTLLQQAQALQEKFKELQEKAASKTIEGEAGGGMVRVVVDGSLHVRSVEIDQALFAANDRAMLQDLIAAAVNDGMHRAQEMVAQEVGRLGPLGGLKIPGLGGD